MQLLAGTLKSEDASCLYQLSTQHAGLCPAFSAIFTGVGSGGRGGNSADATVCASEGATCACNGKVRYGTSEPDRNGDTGPGWHWHSTLSLTVVGCHSLGLYTVILLSWLSFSVEITLSPLARQHERPLVLVADCRGQRRLLEQRLRRPRARLRQELRLPEDGPLR